MKLIFFTSLLILSTASAFSNEGTCRIHINVNSNNPKFVSFSLSSNYDHDTGEFVYQFDLKEILIAAIQPRSDAQTVVDAIVNRAKHVYSIAIPSTVVFRRQGNLNTREAIYQKALEEIRKNILPLLSQFALEAALAKKGSLMDQISDPLETLRENLVGYTSFHCD